MTTSKESIKQTHPVPQQRGDALLISAEEPGDNFSLTPTAQLDNLQCEPPSARQPAANSICMEMAANGAQRARALQHGQPASRVPSVLPVPLTALCTQSPSPIPPAVPALRAAMDTIPSCAIIWAAAPSHSNLNLPSRLPAVQAEHPAFPKEKLSPQHQTSFPQQNYTRASLLRIPTVTRGQTLHPIMLTVLIANLCRRQTPGKVTHALCCTGWMAAGRHSILLLCGRRDCRVLVVFFGGGTASVLQNKQKTALVNTKAKT